MIFPHNLVASSRLVARSSRLESYGGLLYLVATTICSIVYLCLLDPSLANDLYWPLFNVSGHETFLIHALNDKLCIASNGVVDLFSSDAVSRTPESEIAIHFDPNYGRRILFSELNTLGAAVINLRLTATPNNNVLFSQYCWLDFQRRWDIAHTAARSKRCYLKYLTNGAIYFETFARNVNWNDYLSVNIEPWPVAIALALAETSEGIAWLKERPLVAKMLSISQEIAHLRAQNLTYYQSQWHNLVSVSMTENMVLKNALGVTQTFTIKSSNYAIGPWTSLIAFWNFGNDIVGMLTLNTSLVRGNDNHFEMYYDEFSSFYGLQDASGNYVNQVGVFYTQVGPFGSVDTLYVALPPPLTRFFGAFRAKYYDLLRHNTALRSEFNFLPSSTTFQPVPPAFSLPNVSAYYGGNIYCLYNGPTSYPQAQISFNDACAEQTHLEVHATDLSLVFAILVSKGMNVSATCQMNKRVQECIQVLTLAQALANAFDEFPTPPPHPVIHLVQYAEDTTGNWQLLQQQLISTDTSWSFYGWLAVVEWIIGNREVLQIDGDTASHTIISEAYPLATLVTSSGSQAPRTETRILYYLVVYTSVVSCILASMTFASSLLEFKTFFGRNLFVFNRVGCLLWIGRPLLLLRGFTALLLLSTSQALLVRDSEYEIFQANPRTFIESMIVAGEATWIGYVACDALLVLLDRRAHAPLPYITALTWLTTIIIDVSTPVQLTATLDRICYSSDMVKHVQCDSGQVDVGSRDRLNLLALLQVLPVLVSLFIRRLTTKKSKTTEAPLVLPGTSSIFLQYHQDQPNCWHLDNVACIMSGLVPFTFKKCKYIFDLNLWVLLKTSESLGNPRQGFKEYLSSFCTLLPMSQSPKSIPRMGSQLRAAAGLLYVLMSATGSFSYITLSTVNFANDFYWATFNLTGHHSFAAILFNEQVTFGRSHNSMRLDEPRWSLCEYNFSKTSSYTQYPPFLAPRLHDNTRDLTNAVAGLRRTDSCSLPWIFSQYCWVDFDQTYELAHTARRQARCKEDETKNAAVYLESFMRNLNDRAKWNSCWGDAFDGAISRDLHTTSKGVTWLSQTFSASLSVPDEVAYWQRAGLLQYTLQWQNYKTHGLINTYYIENAFGVRYPLTLSHSNGSTAIYSQSMFHMYWSLANDFSSAVHNMSSISGLSMIRSSTRYAFTNMSMESILKENKTLMTPLSESFELIRSLLGPFGSIDMKLTTCPVSLTSFAAKGMDIIRQTLRNPIAASGYSNITRNGVAEIKVYPTSYLQRDKWITGGGNILCNTFGVGTMDTGLGELTGRAVTCDQSIRASFQPWKEIILLASMATNASLDVRRVCSHDARPQLCIKGYVGQSVAFVRRFLASQEVELLNASSVMLEFHSINVSLVQYVQKTVAYPVELLSYQLFDPEDATFFFWSWIFALEWSFGQREVIYFRGDHGQIRVLSAWMTPKYNDIQLHELPTVFAMYARAGVQYITWVIFCVAGSLVVYILGTRGRIEGWNMFEINRVAGIVWVGRPLLFLRGVTALCLLSTATLELKFEELTSTFVVPALPWYVAILGAGETTWLVYILNDLLMIWTKEYTYMYACGSSQLVWLVAAVLTLVNPVVHQVNMDQSCSIEQMDFELVCGSGGISIGYSSRFYLLLGVILLCNVFSYLIAAYRSKKEEDRVDCLLLSSGAKYLFYTSDWSENGTYYMDPASALLNGLISFPLGKCIYMIDIKLWRSFVMRRNVDDENSLYKYALPLTE